MRPASRRRRALRRAAPVCRRAHPIEPISGHAARLLRDARSQHQGDAGRSRGRRLPAAMSSGTVPFRDASPHRPLRFSGRPQTRFLARLSAALAELVAAVPDIERASWGEDVSGNAENHDFALVLDFADREAYARYRSHPAHLRFIETQMREVPMRKVRVQYELDREQTSEGPRDEHRGPTRDGARLDRRQRTGDLPADRSDLGLCRAGLLRDPFGGCALRACCGRTAFRSRWASRNMPTAFVAQLGARAVRASPSCASTTPHPASARRPRRFPDPDPRRSSGFTDLHNGIGVASAGAAVAVAKAMKAHDIDGSVVAFGTPAEKLCVGKPFMARDGLFDGLDAVVAWHPRPYSTRRVGSRTRHAAGRDLRLLSARAPIPPGLGPGSTPSTP